MWRSVPGVGMMAAMWGIAIAAAVIAAVAVLVVAARGLTRQGPRVWGVGRRDDVFAEVTPGVIGATTRRATRADAEAPVAVRFEPPEGMLPEHCGLALERDVQPIDIGAVVVSLAVRGRLRLRRGAGPRDWTIETVSTDPTGLSPTEAALLAALPGQGGVTTLAEVKAPLARVVAAEKSRLRRSEPGPLWLRRGAGGRSLGCLGAVGLALAAFGGVVVGAAVEQFAGGRLAVLALTVAGLLAGLSIVLALRPTPRTALGSAMTFQTKAFRCYLSTAEGDRLRSEEGAAIFSRYLPWAVALGVAKEWARAFAAAARTAEPEVVASWSGDLHWYATDSGIDDGGSGAFDDVGGFSESVGAGIADLGESFSQLGEGIADAMTDLASDLGDVASDIGGSDGSGGSDGGGDGGGGDGGGGGGGD